MIAVELLETYGAVLKPFYKGQRLITEQEAPQFYFQLKTGQVKMFNTTEDGKEFVQSFFETGQSFGEPPLFTNDVYPASAECLSDGEIYQLHKDAFLALLKANPEIHLAFTQLICKRMVYKAKIMQEISIQTAEHRIITLLNYLKKTAQCKGLYKVELTRKQISDLTGLRVETVIRSIKQLAKNNKLVIKNRSVYI